ncbi:DUF2953 domain-containing protein [Inediibacterium massiliense]|uniref:DUF2953 domain-containing protein n=1 Tax=Inediibacterium massiliense TaxID=1658111 RepID=UPI001A9A51B9|nr:DUF2953 domain-containing protein [Inediibacterium massiliense]
MNFKTFFGLFRYNMEIPFLDVDMKKNVKPFLKVRKETNEDMRVSQEEKSILTIEEMKKIHRKIKYLNRLYNHVIEYLRTKIVMDDFFLKIEFGIGDAAVTGIISGFFWMIEGQIFTFIKENINCKEMNIKVCPNFNQQIFKMNLNCIISMKIGYIIIATIKILYTFLIKRR